MTETRTIDAIAIGRRPVCGRRVCRGRRQSMPSSKYPSCAGVIVTVPSADDGQMKRPRSSRLANRHMPWSSCHSTLISEPRGPRNTNRCPLCDHARRLPFVIAAITADSVAAALPAGARYRYTDMRKSFDGLALVVQEKLRRDP
jgi:hypothetical protein